MEAATQTILPGKEATMSDSLPKKLDKVIQINEIRFNSI
jgi:hypothetical protein